MVTFIIPSVLLLAIIAIGLYFWQKTPPQGIRESLPPPPPIGLFAAQDAANQATRESEVQRLAEATQRAGLLARAGNGEKSALEEAHQTGDADVYHQALNLLIEKADSDAKLLSLASYVTRQEFPVNRKLAEAVIESWRRAADRHSTAKALHFAALSDDADLYQSTVEAAFAVWRAGKLPDTSAEELRALFDGEYWILSSKIRSSGAGFLLKRTLAGARRELEAVAGANK
jgi:hypothetical protein